MGNIFSNFFDFISGKMKRKILMVGLDASGKTTILYKLKLGDIEIPTIPTIGCNIEDIEYNNISLTIWDTGGGDKILPLFKHFYPGSNAVIYVVDSTDRERIEEATKLLRHYFNDQKEPLPPLLIFANKQDLLKAMNVEEITEKLNMNTVNIRNYKIQGCCALSGNGLYEGMEWLFQQLTLKINFSINHS